MQLNTPLPYSFATNRGSAAKLKFHDIDAPMHSPSPNKPNLPRNTVLISNQKHHIEYRIQYGPYQYAQLNAHKANSWHKGVTTLSGNSPTMEHNIQFMDTVKSLHPLVMQLFSS